MPILDKPLKELKTYTGVSPKPADFDEFWDARLKRLRSLKPEYKLGDPGIKCKGAIINSLDFIAEDGSSVHCRVVRPDTKEKVPVLFEFHGLAGACGGYSGKLKWAMAGFAVVAMDCRGQGGFSSDNAVREGMNLRGSIVRGVDGAPDQLYYVSVYSDIVQLVELVKGMEFADADRMFAHGGSQGGGLTVACAALCADDIKGIAPVYPYLSDFRRVYEMDMIERAYEDIKYYLRSFLPQEDAREKFWNALGYIDIQNLAPRIKAETYWYCGLMDNVCPPSTQFACYNKIKSKKNMYIASYHGHESQPREWEDNEFKFLTHIAGLDG